MHLLPVPNLLIRMNLFFCTGSSGFALCRTKQSSELFCERGRSETSPESESEVDGNEVKSTTGTSVKQIQDSSRSQLTI